MSITITRKLMLELRYSKLTNLKIISLAIVKMVSKMIKAKSRIDKV